MKYNPTLYVSSVCFVSILDSVDLHCVVNPTVHHLAPAHEGKGICKTHQRAAIRGKDLQLYAEICNKKNTSDNLKEQIPSEVPPKHSDNVLLLVIA